MSLESSASEPLLRHVPVRTLSPRPLLAGGWPLALAGSGLIACALSLSLALLVDLRLHAVGRGELAIRPEDSGIVIAGITSAMVGASLALRRPGHPVGWLFLFLGFAICSAGLTDGYAAYGELARPGSLPASGLVAIWSDAAFVFFLLPIVLVLLVTPSGGLISPRWRWVWWSAIGSAFMSLVLRMISPREMDGALRGVQNPLAIDPWGERLEWLGFTALIVLHLDLLAAVVSLFVRYRRAGPVERLQLRWLVIAAAFLPAFVTGAFVAATLNQQFLLSVSAGAFASLLPISTALAIDQCHLYDVDRLLSRALTYTLLSVSLALIYAVSVVVVGQSIPSSGMATVLATLAAAVAARPVRDWLQQGLDRRFNRRNFDALSSIRRFARQTSPSESVETALAAAASDGTLSVSYWVDERKTWLGADGRIVKPGPHMVAISRHGEPVAAITFSPKNVEQRIVEAIANEVHAELESARLRAAITLQLVEVRESRARIVEAQVAERRRIERNLHDGAQQRLLGLALQFRAAEVSGQPTRALQALNLGVGQLQEAVRELRELANGLRPAALNDGGLAAALDDLSARSPVEVQHDVARERFSPAVEETAWFIICEAATNA